MLGTASSGNKHYNIKKHPRNCTKKVPQKILLLKAGEATSNFFF